ncbi:MAG: type II toxin-antitoxin system VapC family toxin [Rhodomicrobium sp.]
MIVIDSSALLAILFSEPEKGAFEGAIKGARRCLISAVNVHETATVLRLRLGASAVERLWEILRLSQIEIVPFDEAQMRAAVEAYGRYGKGIHSKARLNLADCASYALAKTMDAPLLFKGDDFAHTDIKPYA